MAQCSVSLIGPRTPLHKISEQTRGGELAIKLNNVYIIIFFILKKKKNNDTLYIYVV